MMNMDKLFFVFSGWKAFIRITQTIFVSQDDHGDISLPLPGNERPSIEESKLKKQFVGISLSATKLKSTIKKARGSKDTTTNDNKGKIVTNFVYTHCIHRNVMYYILYSGYFCGVNNLWISPKGFNHTILCV